MQEFLAAAGNLSTDARPVWRLRAESRALRGESWLEPTVRRRADLGAEPVARRCDVGPRTGVGPLRQSPALCRTRGGHGGGRHASRLRHGAADPDGWLCARW